MTAKLLIIVLDDKFKYRHDCPLLDNLRDKLDKLSRVYCLKFNSKKYQQQIIECLKTKQVDIILTRIRVSLDSDKETMKIINHIKYNSGYPIDIQPIISSDISHKLSIEITEITDITSYLNKILENSEITLHYRNRQRLQKLLFGFILYQSLTVITSH